MAGWSCRHLDVRTQTPKEITPVVRSPFLPLVFLASVAAATACGSATGAKQPVAQKVAGCSSDGTLCTAPSGVAGPVQPGLNPPPGFCLPAGATPPAPGSL